MDFTLITYLRLLDALEKSSYQFQSFEDFLKSPGTRTLILRHDVDSRPENSLAFARIQQKLGIRGSYYFRMVPQSYDERIIREIAALGHEIGYHYETMDTCNGDMEKAYEEFCRNLETLRKIVPVNTICMHGSPLSKYDNRDLWQGAQSSVVSRQSSVKTQNVILSPSFVRINSAKDLTRNPKPETRNLYDYRSLGIIGEPYFDIDFTKVFYLTDTGRRWDGAGVSVRDKVASQQSSVVSRQSSVSSRQSEVRSQKSEVIQNSKFKTQNLRLRHTKDIIANAHLLPDQIMFTFHPQRWTDRFGPWLQELLWQNVKNVGKRLLVSR